MEEDLHHPHTFGFLLGLAVQGRLAALVGGPPCKTYTAARHNDVGPNGPVPLRGVGEASYGLSTLSACEQVCVDRDTLLYLKFLLLACVGRQARLDLSMSWCSVLESPEDPIKVFGSPQDGQGRSYPSWWRTPAWTEFAKVEPVTELSLDQGPLGHTSDGVSPEPPAVRASYVDRTTAGWDQHVCQITCLDVAIAFTVSKGNFNLGPPSERESLKHTRCRLIWWGPWLRASMNIIRQ